MNNISFQAKQFLSTNELDEYLISPLEDILELTEDAKKAWEAEEFKLFGWKMFFIGAQVETFNKQDFIQDSGRAINSKIIQEDALADINKTKKTAQNERDEHIKFLDNEFLLNDPKIKATRSAQKMLISMRNYDKAKKLNYSEKRYEKSLAEKIREIRSHKKDSA